MNTLPKTLVGVIAALGLSTVASQATLTEYSNDFSSGTAAGISGSNAVETAPNGEKFVGFLNSETASLDLTGLAAHTSLTVGFDVIGLRSLDGVTNGDNFQFSVDGALQFTDYFGHSSGVIIGPTTGTLVSHDRNAFGYGFYWGGASIYHYSLTFPHSASSIDLDFTGNADQRWMDEAFGLDNVVVSTNANAAVPDGGATILMLGSSLLGFGAVRRKLK